MDVDAYLERIDYRGPRAPTAETLGRLHVAHLLTVPFENLSIHAAEPVVLDDESLFDKVVARGRGGFCYELNGLFAAPLLVDERAEQTQGARSFRIEEEGGGRLVLLRRDAEGGWEPQYRFGLEPHAYEDYAELCRFHQTSPESHFTRGRVCSRLTPEGRVTLSGSRLITTRGGERIERELADEAERDAALLEHFRISLRGRGANP